EPRLRRHPGRADLGDRDRARRPPAAVRREPGAAGPGVKAVILAAGYATRLYPLTLDRPKHLLEIGGKPMLDHLRGRLPLAELEAIYVVTNAKFAPSFREWSEAHPAPIAVVD